MKPALFLLLLSISWNGAWPETSPDNSPSLVRIEKGESFPAIVKKAARVKPSPRQIAWQELEFTCFIHFGMNTFTNREWGEKGTNPANFNPTALDARQWAGTAKMAGAKLLVMVAKHHDGFCLWPSRHTGYTVARSPWKNGTGDVIAEASAACREYGLTFGVYLSPWDINSPLYGKPEYNEFFKDQLRELLTNYGEVSEVWFDGACGEGPNGKRQVYDWRGYYQVIRELRPDAVIAVMGPDVRWVGTESGYGRETEWSVVPATPSMLEEIAQNSQQTEGAGTFTPPGNMMEQDLGSREKLRNAQELFWYPSEVDVSIRSGWFYHAAEDSLVKTPEKLADIWFSSVGRNSVLLLNLPPDKRGLIHENDVKSLRGMRDILDATFRTNLAGKATLAASNPNQKFDLRSILDSDNKTFWTPGPGVTSCTLEFDLGEQKTFDCLLVQENFRNGQRVEEFTLEAWRNGKWEEISRGTTIGYKRLLRFPAVTVQKVRLRILSSRDYPEIATFGLYKLPD
ncbi:MAG: alpha-L-fucosidase [Candidatus Latescibacterota bacterium]